MWVCSFHVVHAAMVCQVTKQPYVFRAATFTVIHNDVACLKVSAFCHEVLEASGVLSIVAVMVPRLHHFAPQHFFWAALKRPCIPIHRRRDERRPVAAMDTAGSLAAPNMVQPPAGHGSVRGSAGPGAVADEPAALEPPADQPAAAPASAWTDLGEEPDDTAELEAPAGQPAASEEEPADQPAASGEEPTATLSEDKKRRRIPAANEENWVEPKRVGAWRASESFPADQQREPLSPWQQSAPPPADETRGPRPWRASESHPADQPRDL